MEEHKDNYYQGLAQTDKAQSSTKLHPGACKFSLQYVVRPDGRLSERVGTQKLGSLSGKGEEVCKVLRKRMIDVCCLHEVR